MYNFIYQISVFRNGTLLKSASFMTLKSLMYFYKILRKSELSNNPELVKFFDTRFSVSIKISDFGCLHGSSTKSVRLVSNEAFLFYLKDLHRAASSDYVHKYLKF